LAEILRSFCLLIDFDFSFASGVLALMAPLEADFLWLLAFGIALGRVQGARDRIDRKGCAADWLY